MYQYSRKKLKFFLCVTFLPYVLTCQLYYNQNFTELSSHFFGLSYYPTAWQSSIFEEDIHTNFSIKEKVAFNKLSNALNRLLWNIGIFPHCPRNYEFPNSLFSLLDQ